MKNRTTKNEFWYYRVGSGKQTDCYWERRILVVLRYQSDTVVNRNTFLGFIPKLLAGDSIWWTILCEFLRKNYWTGRTGEKRQKKQTWESNEMMQRSAGWAWLSGRAMGTHSHSPLQFLLSSSMIRIFIPFPTFFLSVPGKDELLMDFCPAPEELCNPAQRSSSSQQTGCIFLYSASPISQPTDEFPSLLLFLRPSRCSCGVAEGIAGHSWASPAEVPAWTRALSNPPTCAVIPAAPLIILILHLPSPALHLYSIPSPAREKGKNIYIKIYIIISIIYKIHPYIIY